MNKEKFLHDLKIALNKHDDITENDVLSKIPEWDSLGIICTITMLNSEYNYQTDFDKLKSVSTVKDLMDNVCVAYNKRTADGADK